MNELFQSQHTTWPPWALKTIESNDPPELILGGACDLWKGR